MLECADDEFNCDVTRCIPKEKQCDGTHDCQDETDEINCPSLETTTTASSTGECLTIKIIICSHESLKKIYATFEKKNQFLFIAFDGGAFA